MPPWLDCLGAGHQAGNACGSAIGPGYPSAIAPRDLIGQPSTQQPDLLLVQPFDPERSYLMHKLLWDYPLREGTAQPTPWDGGAPLPEQDLRLIERWIRGGALR